MRAQFESIRDGLAEIAILDEKMRAGKAEIAKHEREAALAREEAALAREETALARETLNLLNFAGYSVLAAIGNDLTPSQREEYSKALEKFLSDEAARKVFQTDRTLALAQNLRIVLSSRDKPVVISKDLLQSIARVTALKQRIIREADAFNPGTAAGFRGPLRELSRLSGVTISFE